MSSEATSPRRSGARLAKSIGILGFLNSHLTRPSDNTAVAQAQVKAQAVTKARHPECEELIKDRRKLVHAIARYLALYPSVGSIRMAIDLLPCLDDPIEAFLKYIKPVLLVLEKMGFVELVRGDPVVGVMVVNLNLPNLVAQARGGGDGSGQ